MVADSRYDNLLLGLSNQAYAELICQPSLWKYVLQPYLLPLTSGRGHGDEETYGFDVDGPVGDDNVRGMCLFVDVILVGRFYEGKVLFENAFEMAAALINIAY